MTTTQEERSRAAVFAEYDVQAERAGLDREKIHAAGLHALVSGLQSGYVWECCDAALRYAG